MRNLSLVTRGSASVWVVGLLACGWSIETSPFALVSEF